MAAYAVSLFSILILLYILYKSKYERGSFFEKGIDTETGGTFACGAVDFLTVRVQQGAGCCGVHG